MPNKIIFFKDNPESKEVLRKTFNIPETVEIVDGLENGGVIFIVAAEEDVR